MNSIFDDYYDFVIIGGGATGSGIALDASSRGYKVLLLEKDDFASGSSSKSSKLIHGGVRYLEKAIKQLDIKQYKLVKEGLSERAIFLHNAPHLAKKLKIDTPLYSWIEGFYIYVGLYIYKLISGKKNIGKNNFLNTIVLQLLQPSLKKEKLKGAISFYDGRFLDSRMVIALLQTAQSFDALVKNYSEVKSFIYDDSKKIEGLIYHDKLLKKNIEVKAKYIINATGSNVDNIRLKDDEKAEEMLSLSSGVHIVLPKKFLPFDEGILIPKTKDGRVIFILPYLDKCLVGTTDNHSKYLNNPKVTLLEIEYLLIHINEYFEIKATKKDIISSWSGLRPLIKSFKNKSTQQVIREHLITKSKTGLISIAGGKWTTYRKMAEELVDFVFENNSLKEKCKTKNLKVIGSQIDIQVIKKLLDSFNISRQTKESLIRLYGDKAIEVLQIAKEFDNFDLIDKNLPYLKAEIIYCIKYEFVKKPIDFLARRINLCFIEKENALLCVDAVVEQMSEILFWDKEKKEIEKEEAIKFIYKYF